MVLCCHRRMPCKVKPRGAAPIASDHLWARVPFLGGDLTSGIRGCVLSSKSAGDFRSLIPQVTSWTLGNAYAERYHSRAGARVSLPRCINHNQA